MARRKSLGRQLQEQEQAFHDGDIAGQTLAAAHPEAKRASIDQIRELADGMKLSGRAREEFIKGCGWGFAGKRYALPD